MLLRLRSFDRSSNTMKEENISFDWLPATMLGEANHQREY
jgi:hypothetical protein